MKNSIKLLILLVFLPVFTFANPHQEVWMKASFSAPVQKKIKISGEFQHRRQNAHDNSNMFSKNYAFLVKPWIVYQHNKSISFKLSPIAYYANYSLINVLADESKDPRHEARISAGIDWNGNLFKNASLKNSSVLEYRVFKKEFTNLTRFRNKLEFSYSIKKVKLSIADELIFNLTGKDISHFFDQNRASATLGYDFGQGVGAYAGYLRLTRLTSNNYKKAFENIFLVGINYQLQKSKKK